MTDKWIHALAKVAGFAFAASRLLGIAFRMTRGDELRAAGEAAGAGTGGTSAGGDVDRVQEASEESFPASDAPAWPGMVAAPT
jgi:hypothetical protein